MTDSNTYCRIINFIADDLVENDESFYALLTTTDPDVILYPSSAMIVIENNDSKYSGP